MLVFSATIFSSDFIKDDCYVIAENFLLRSWRSLGGLLKTGYWEGALGAEAPVQEFRPALMLTYFFNYLLSGPGVWAYHFFNVILHSINSVLIFSFLGRFYARRIAYAAALLFAVLPVHCEAVAYISGRSELLLLTFLLISWTELHKNPKPSVSGIGCFCLALLTKEQAVVFPAVVCMADWVFFRKTIWEPPERKKILWLVSCVVVYFIMRGLVLSRAIHGGVDYFAGQTYLIRLLTMSRFAGEHYLFPLVFGLNLRADYSKPLIPFASSCDWFAWAYLTAGVSAMCFSAWFLIKTRSKTAFWLLFSFIFILPVSNLIFSLDTIGAERFLYIPSLVFCLFAAQLLERVSPRYIKIAFVSLLTWYGYLTLERSIVWTSAHNYYKASVKENPVSAGARSGLGVVLMQKGMHEEAENLFLVAVNLSPQGAAPYYNLGMLYFEKNDMNKAGMYFEKAIEKNPANADAFIYMALICERQKKIESAEKFYIRALDLRSWDARAQYNIARLYLTSGKYEEALRHFREFLRLDPSDPAAAAVKRLLADIKQQP